MKKKEKIRQGRAERKQEEEKTKKIKKAGKIVLYAAMFLGLTVLANLLLRQASTVSFEEATFGDSLIREKFIEQTTKEAGLEKRLISYIDTSEKMEILKKEWGFQPKPEGLMAIHAKDLSIESLGKRTFPVRISVFPLAFNGRIIKTKADFISSLLHENRHIRNIQKGKIGSINMALSFFDKEGKFNESLAHDIDEMDAFGMELAENEAISPPYREGVMRRYLDYYIGVWDHSENMNSEFTQTLKIQFFENWMLNRPELKAEIVSGRKNWYLEHPATKKKHYLPEEIIGQYGRN